MDANICYSYGFQINALNLPGFVCLMQLCELHAFTLWG
uniref:Uncharacterized protein n=1 Tax=Rhizophora mucronata TaxID=61149 RepID=A0A2P2PQH4_RHIMU